METFHFIVIVIAAIILIGTLTWFGVTIRNSKTAAVGAYPPIFSECPDYWEKSSTGECIVPTLRNKPELPLLGTMTTDPSGNVIYNGSGYTPGYSDISGVDFSVSAWDSYGIKNGNVSKECVYREWANRVGVAWDGITNYNQCN